VAGVDFVLGYLYDTKYRKAHPRSYAVLYPLLQLWTVSQFAVASVAIASVCLVMREALDTLARMAQRVHDVRALVPHMLLASQLIRKYNRVFGTAASLVFIGITGDLVYAVVGLAHGGRNDQYTGAWHIAVSFVVAVPILLLPAARVSRIKQELLDCLNDNMNYRAGTESHLERSTSRSSNLCDLDQTTAAMMDAATASSSSLSASDRGNHLREVMQRLAHMHMSCTILSVPVKMSTIVRVYYSVVLVGFALMRLLTEK
jgi:hypothetical protein